MPRLLRIRWIAVARRRSSLLSCLALVTGLLIAQPARAMVPYVYVPQSGELEAAGLGIAQAAARLLRLGQAEDAARLAELTVRLMPEDPRGWVLLAEAELRSNKSEKALVALARAKALDPGNAGIWFAEGSLALRNGRPQDALGLIRKGLQLDAKNASAYFDLGNAEVLLGNSSGALAAFEKAADLRKDFWEAINNQGLVLFERGNTNEAINRWQRVLKIKADVAETSLALAAALFSREGADRAAILKLAESALAEEPNYVLEAYQKDQLWGERLRKATRRLLELPELKGSVDRANANASGSDKDSEQ